MLLQRVDEVADHTAVVQRIQEETPLVVAAQHHVMRQPWDHFHESGFAHALVIEAWCEELRRGGRKMKKSKAKSMSLGCCPVTGREITARAPYLGAYDRR